MAETNLRRWVLGQTGYRAPPGLIGTPDAARLNLAILAEVEY